MTTFRVTQTMMSQRSLTSLQGGLARLAEVQEKLSTGRILNRPSDSPTDTTAAMRLRSSLASAQQHGRNAQDGMGWLSQADTTLQSMAAQVRRTRDLALQGANQGALPQSAREALAVEVDRALPDERLPIGFKDLQPIAIVQRIEAVIAPLAVLVDGPDDAFEAGLEPCQQGALDQGARVSALVHEKAPLCIRRSKALTVSRPSSVSRNEAGARPPSAPPNRSPPKPCAPGWKESHDRGNPLRHGRPDR